jgi:hypothetical protein
MSHAGKVSREGAIGHDHCTALGREDLMPLRAALAAGVTDDTGRVQGSTDARDLEGSADLLPISRLHDDVRNTEVLDRCVVCSDEILQFSILGLHDLSRRWEVLRARAMCHTPGVQCDVHLAFLLGGVDLDILVVIIVIFHPIQRCDEIPGIILEVRPIGLILILYVVEPSIALASQDVCATDADVIARARADRTVRYVRGRPALYPTVGARS